MRVHQDAHRRGWHTSHGHLLGRNGSEVLEACKPKRASRHLELTCHLGDGAERIHTLLAKREASELMERVISAFRLLVCTALVNSCFRVPDLVSSYGDFVDLKVGRTRFDHAAYTRQRP